MKCNRKSIRLNKYDYSNNGYYFVTICTQNRWNIFGEIENGKMILNDIGEMVLKIWNEIPNNYNGIEIDEFILMPDHLHGILVINKKIQTNNLSNGRTQWSAPTMGILGTMNIKSETLGIIIKKFKTLTTKIFIDNVKTNNWPRFYKRLWQRNYFERIIRNEKKYFKIKNYIKNNVINVGVDPCVDPSMIRK